MVVTSASVGPNVAWSARRTASACVVGVATGAAGGVAAGGVGAGDGVGAGAGPGDGAGDGEGAGEGDGEGFGVGDGLGEGLGALGLFGASAVGVPGEAVSLPPPQPAIAAVTTAIAVTACQRERQ